MENVNSTQVSPGEISDGRHKRTVHRVIEASKWKLDAELATEERQKLLLQSQIAAIQERVKQTGIPELQKEIETLETKIETKRAILDSKSQDLLRVRENEQQLSIPKSPKTQQLEREIVNCRQRIVQMKADLEGDDFDQDSEIIALRARHLTLIQIKNGEIEDTQIRLRKYSAGLSELLHHSDIRRDEKLESIQAMMNSGSPMKRRLEFLNRRRNQLNEVIGVLQNGVPTVCLAEEANSKMRKALRDRYRL
jgi:hypothetical protein